MKHLITLVALTLLCTTVSAQASHRSRGYVTKKGTYVAPHRSTNPDHSKANNWSTKGNSNPYTGRKGTKDPYAPPRRRKH